MSKKTVNAPSNKRSIQNSEKIVVQPCIHKVEVHTTQNKILPSTQRSVQNSKKILVQTYVQKVEAHTTQKKTLPLTQRQSIVKSSVLSTIDGGQKA